jgi:hypothetical protein
MVPVLAACLLLCLSAWAQEDVLRPRGAPLFQPFQEERRLPILLGIESGVNVNFSSQDLQYSRPISNTPPQLFKSGNGFSPIEAIAVDVGLSPRLGLQFKAGYDVKTIGNSGTAEADCQNLFDPTQVTTEPLSTEWKWTLEYIALGAGLRYDLTPQLWLTIGGVAHFHVSNRQTTTYTAPKNSDCGFLNPEDGQLYRQVTIESETKRPPLKSSRFGAELGIGYKLPLNPKLWLVPRLQFQLLSSPREDIQGFDGWKRFTQGIADVTARALSLYSLQLLVGLWFGL